MGQDSEILGVDLNNSVGITLAIEPFRRQTRQSHHPVTRLTFNFQRTKTQITRQTN